MPEIHLIRRAGVRTAVAGLALALLTGAPALPAAAEELDDDAVAVAFAPTIELDRTTFAAGDWDGGFTVTGSGFDPSVPEVAVNGYAGMGTLFLEWTAVAVDGTFTAHILPVDQVNADSPDRPTYAVFAAQNLVDGSTIYSNEVPLTITAGAGAEAETPIEPEAEPAAPGVEAEPVGEAAGTIDAGGAPRELAETGFDGVAGLAALALIAFGAATVLVARRRAHSH